MKKSFKVIISMTLAMCLVVSQSSAVFAITAQKQTENTVAEDEVWYTDEALLARLGHSNAKELDGTVKPRYLLDDKTEVTILENTPSHVELKFNEKGNVDILSLSSDNRAYLNGEEIKVTDSAGNRVPISLFSDEVTVEPKAGFSTYFTSRCPYGSAGDYTHRYGTEKDGNIALTNQLKDIATNTFISIMCSFFGVMKNLSESVMKGIYDWLKTTDPQTDALSYSATVWTHKSYTSGYIPSLFTFVYKWSLKLYSKENYKGNVKYQVVYKCKLTV